MGLSASLAAYVHLLTPESPIMIEQFVTPLESRLCEKSFSTNAEEVYSPSLIRSCWVDAGAYIHLYLIKGCTGVVRCVRPVRCINTGVVRCVHSGVVRCIHTGVVQVRAYQFTNTGVVLFSTNVLTYE